MKRFFDPLNSRLLYVGERAERSFWDKQWEGLGTDQFFRNPPKQRYLRCLVARFLPKNARILEAGCGLGNKIYAFHKDRYKVLGIDYARQTVLNVKKNWPELRLCVGDVRELPLQDEVFDGCFSFGIIEHFYEGYGVIVDEIARTLKTGGFVFVTFPVFNRCRQKRAKKNCYTVYNGYDREPDSFYQFALNSGSVRSLFRKKGFECIIQKGQGVWKGIAEEYPRISRIVKVLKGMPFGIGTFIGILLDRVVGANWGHTCLMVMRKSKYEEPS